MTIWAGHARDATNSKLGTVLVRRTVVCRGGIVFANLAVTASIIVARRRCGLENEL